MAKLWDKGYALDKSIEHYTVGDDPVIDLVLVRHDCITSKAHAKMLHKSGVLDSDETAKIISVLEEIISLAGQGKFNISQEDEDCHTAIENHLTAELGETGKKIHTARSRNDQILVALRLYEKEQISEILKLGEAFMIAAGKIADVPFPGYTHTRKAMPSSSRMWAGAYADCIKDDMEMLSSVLKIIDMSPLGSGAGYGIPVFDVDRQHTAEELGFTSVQENPVHCQLSRGKYEAMILSALSQMMLDLNRLATDLILFSTEEFAYVRLPKEYCTGSSIMPQKMNPDVLELMRAKYHVVASEEAKVKGICSNLISGYNRDMQLTKKPIIESFSIVEESLIIAAAVIGSIEFDKEGCAKALTPDIYAAEEAYKLVRQGMAFRDAYKKVAEGISNRKP